MCRVDDGVVVAAERPVPRAGVMNLRGEGVAIVLSCPALLWIRIDLVVVGG